MAVGPLPHRFEVDVCAAADGCLLSVWPYVALHRSDQHIVLRTGNIHLYICACVDADRHTYIQTDIHHIYLSLHLCIHTYPHTHIYTHTHTHTHPLPD